MANELLLEFSLELKKAREKKKINLTTIHNKTRIDIKYLKAIEEANFNIMPDVYMTAFLKEYASIVGLDPENTIVKYKNAKIGKVTIVEENSEEESSKKANNTKVFNDETEYNSSGRNQKKSFILEYDMLFKVGLFVATILIFVAIYFLFFRETKQEIIKETPYEEILQEKTKSFEDKKEEINNTETFVSDSLVLDINAVDTVWMKVEIDDIIEKEFIMFPDRKKSLKAADYFVLHLGNAGGAEFLLNNKKLDYSGKRGRVQTIKIDKLGWAIIQKSDKVMNEND